MVNEHIDPAYKYIDGKIKLLKRELQQLKQTHDAVAAEQEQALLNTQRDMAAFITTSTAENVLSFVRKDKPQLHKHFSPQFYASAGTAKSEAKSSNDPLSVAAEFHKRCYDALDELGIEIVRLS